ncbi:hypothetical protein HK096_010878, partial [Nowakowskiella sp. JEL0078]
MDASYKQTLKKSEDDPGTSLLGITLLLIIFVLFVLIPLVNSKYVRSKFSSLIVTYLDAPKRLSSAKRLLEEESKTRQKVKNSSNKKLVSQRFLRKVKKISSDFDDDSTFINDDSEVDDLILLGELAGRKSGKSPDALSPSRISNELPIGQSTMSRNVVHVEGRYDSQFVAEFVSEAPGFRPRELSKNSERKSSGASTIIEVEQVPQIEIVEKDVLKTLVTNSSETVTAIIPRNIEEEKKIVNQVESSLKKENEVLKSKSYELETKLRILEDSNRALTQSFVSTQKTNNEVKEKAQSELKDATKIIEDLKLKLSKLQ